MANVLIVNASHEINDDLEQARFIVGGRERRAGEVRISEEPEGYYAVHELIGVGRIRATPEEAVVDFLTATGYSNIQVEALAEGS